MSCQASRTLTLKSMNLINRGDIFVSSSTVALLNIPCNSPMREEVLPYFADEETESSHSVKLPSASASLSKLWESFTVGGWNHQP